MQLMYSSVQYRSTVSWASNPLHLVPADPHRFSTAGKYHQPKIYTVDDEHAEIIDKYKSFDNPFLIAYGQVWKQLI